MAKCIFQAEFSKQIGREEDDSGNEYGLQADAEKHLYIESHVDYTAQPKISMPQHACRAKGMKPGHLSNIVYIVLNGLQGT